MFIKLQVLFGSLSFYFLSPRSLDKHFGSLLIKFFVLSTVGSTQATWWLKIFAASIHCEAGFLERLWRSFSVRRWVEMRVLGSLWRNWSTVQDNYSISAGETLGRAFMVFGLVAGGVEEVQFFGTVLMETPTHLISISLGRHHRRGNMLS